MHSLLAKDPLERPQTAKHVIEACETLLHAVPDDFERVITYESEEAQALQIDRSQAYTLPEEALSRTEVNRLAESDNQVAETIAIDAPPMPRSRVRTALMAIVMLGMLGVGGLIWGYQQLEPIPEKARQLIPKAPLGADVPPIPSEQVTVTASANVDNVTVLDVQSGKVVGVLPNKNAEKSFQWLKESGRKVTLEFRHGGLAPIRRTVDLGKDSTVPRAEFVLAAASPAVAVINTVNLRVISNQDAVLIALSDREAAYPLAENVREKIVKVPTGSEPVRVTVTRPGFLPATSTFVPTADGEVRVSLVADPKATGPAPTVPVTLDVNVGSVDVVLPSGLKYVTPKMRDDNLVIQLAQGTTPVRLTLSKRGYDDATLEVVPDAKKTVTARLNRRKRPVRQPQASSSSGKTKPPTATPDKNPRLSPIKKPKSTGPGRLGRLKGF